MNSRILLCVVCAFLVSCFKFEKTFNTYSNSSSIQEIQEPRVPKEILIRDLLILQENYDRVSAQMEQYSQQNKLDFVKIYKVQQDAIKDQIIITAKEINDPDLLPEQTRKLLEK